MESAFSRLDRVERRIRKKRIIASIPVVRLRDRSNPLELYDSVQFKQRFHMYKETMVFLCNLIKEDICCQLRRGCQIPPILQLAVTVRFYATGSFQIVCGDLSDLTQGTVSKIVARVSRAICKRRTNFLNYPSFEEAAIIRQGFFDIGSFPGVVGAVDGCHICISSPGGTEAELFRNRKSQFSINVQAVCDHNLVFTDIVSRWYGSAHDSRIFENSDICFRLEEGHVPGILLGDSGYALLPFLMTPLGVVTSPAQKRYQTAHLRTRNTIERCFGVWKRRFPCLKFLRLKTSTTLLVIVATAILHNICRKRGDIFQNDYFVPEENDDDPKPQPTITGLAVRNGLISNYFSNL